MRIKDFFNTIKKYFNKINFVRSISKSIIYSTIICIFFITADIYNLPSKLKDDIPSILWGILIVGAIIIAIVSLTNIHLVQQFRYKAVNVFDSSLLSILYILGSWTGYCICSNNINNYKSIIGLALSGLTFVSIIIRFIVFYKTTQNLIYSKSSILDLKDIYENNFSIKLGQPILVSEKDVSYDMLNRNGIVNQLYNYIYSYCSDRAFTIALVGEWGCGKTTIINNVKEQLTNNKVIVIDDIDPWLLGSKEALLTTMYEKIIDKTDIRFSLAKTRSIINSLKRIVSGYIDKKVGLPNLIDLINDLSDDEYDEVEHIEMQIGSYLLDQNKKVVFVIDNLERASAENIIFLFKLISTVFDLPNIIYLLSYDQARMNEILSDTAQINPKFIEKIVQQEIHIPSIDSDRLGTIFSVCTANIINKYIEHEIEISCYLPIINHICKNTKNVRHYKRLINSAFTSTFCNEYDLDIPTLLMLEIIHFEAPKLYEVIQENREYFISSDVMCDVNLYLFQRRSDKFNEEGKAFFDELFDKFSTFKELLCNFFPFIYRYKSGFNLIEKYDSSIPDCIKSDFPIYSIKYFDIYFSLSTNDFAKNISEMQMLMKEINSKKSIKDSVVNKLINIDSDNQRERFEYLDMHIDSLSGSVSFQLINIIWDNILSIDDSNLFFMLNAQQRALVIMAKLIKKLEMDKLEEITHNFKTEYNKLQFISSLIYWLNSDKIGISGEIISLFNKLYSDMCATIVGNKVNLYDRHNYSQHNIYALSRNYQNNLEVIKQYFSDIYRSEYVYKVLADLVGESTGSKGYGYAIDKQNLDLLGVTIAQIANSIETYPPKTESENKLKEIFDKVVNDEKNIFDHFGINSPIPIKFDV